MKIITKAEINKLTLIKKRGQHPENPVVTEVMKLKAGEWILVDKEDWKPKTPIHQGIRDNSPARKVKARFSIKTLADNKGWLIQRKS